MDNYSPDQFGNVAADYYDNYLVQREPPSDSVIELLMQLAGKSRRLLEVGAGTGRFAIPLAKAGVKVTAVDISHSMLGKLVGRALAEGMELPAYALDATRTLPPGQFEVIGYFFNTLFMVGDRNCQRESLRLAAAQLSNSGYVVVEAFVPSQSMFGEGTSSDFRVLQVTLESVVMAARVVTKETQTVDVQEIVMADGDVKLIPHVMYYLSLAQLDELCGQVGLKLVERWQDWAKTPIQPDSKNAISVYGKAN
jgi:SAM-dependent methyltransferase